MEYLIPTTAEAVKIYEENGGVLTGDVQFGHDPLGNREDLYESREHLMKSNFPNPGEVFSDIVQNDHRSLERCIEAFYLMAQALHSL